MLIKPQLGYDVLQTDIDQTEAINETDIKVVEHDSKIMQLLNWMGLVADYVIETGSNKHGTWEKWYSGKLVQRGYNETDVVDGNLRMKTQIFPIPFIDNDYIVFGSANTTAASNIDAPVFSRTSNSRMLVSVIRRTNGSVNDFWEAIGSWK